MLLIISSGSRFVDSVGFARNSKDRHCCHIQSPSLEDLKQDSLQTEETHDPPSEVEKYCIEIRVKEVISLPSETEASRRFRRKFGNIFSTLFLHFQWQVQADPPAGEEWIQQGMPANDSGFAHSILTLQVHSWFDFASERVQEHDLHPSGCPFACILGHQSLSELHQGYWGQWQYQSLTRDSIRGEKQLQATAAPKGTGLHLQF